MTRPLRNWRALSSNQHYILGADGMPVLMTTDARVQALESVDCLRYVFDTNELSVEGIAGCSAGEVEPDTYDPRFWAVDLRLDRPLGVDEVAEIRYRTLFHYSTPPDNELVQGGSARGVPEVTLHVEFHPQKAAVQNARWDLFSKAGVIDSGELAMQQGSNPYLLHWAMDLLPNHFLAIRWDWAE